MWEKTPITEARRLENQFLVHSYLYYVENEAVISDSKYDEICKGLLEIKKFVKPQYEITNGLDGAGSGYYIQDYPKNIVTTALRLLYWRQSEEITFEEFLRKRKMSLKKT